MEALVEFQALRRFVAALLQRRLEPSLLRVARSVELGLTEAEEGSALADELHRARACCADAQRLVERLAAFAAQRPPALQRLALGAWLAAVAPELERAIAPDTALRVEPAAEQELCVLADPDLLLLALREVLTNAQQAGARTVALRLARHEGGALLQICDDGPGVSRALCEPAPESEPLVTLRRDALGLGLATVLGIVDQHRGRLLIESTAGHGTAVSAFLPLAAAEIHTSPAPAPALAPTPTPTPAPTPRPAPASEEDRARTLLVAEDEPLLRRTIKHLLRPLGHVLLEACSASEALALADQRAGSIDLLITDVVMPDGGGIQLAATLRARFPSLRVLFTSGYPGETLSGLPPDAEFLQKPFTASDLQGRVRDILRSRRGPEDDDKDP